MRTRGRLPILAAALAVATLGCVIAYEEPARPPLSRPIPPPPPLGTTVSFFYDSLDPWGDWIWSDGWGWVWTPTHVVASWRPYFDGHWVYTYDGWYWMSDEPWAWAAYHYGRWSWVPRYGWVWVPGREWAPAWVAWRHGQGWIGWAPLPPGAVWAGGRLDVRVAIEVDRWCFVEETRFVEPHVHRYAVPVGRNTTLVRTTREATRYVVEGNRVVDRAIDVERIRMATRKDVPHWRIDDVDSPSQAGPAGGETRAVRAWRRAIAEPAPDAKPRRTAPGRIAKEDVEDRADQARDPAPPQAAPRPRPTPAPDPTAAPPPAPPARPYRTTRPRTTPAPDVETERRRLESEQASERERLARQQAQESRRAADESTRRALEERQDEERRLQDQKANRDRRLLDTRKRRAQQGAAPPAKADEKKEKEEKQQDEDPPERR